MASAGGLSNVRGGMGGSIVARPVGRAGATSTGGGAEGRAETAAPAPTSINPSGASSCGRRARKRNNQIPPIDVSSHTRIGPPRPGPATRSVGELSLPSVEPDPPDPAAGVGVGVGVGVGDAVGDAETDGPGVPSGPDGVGSGDGGATPPVIGDGITLASGIGRVGALGRGVGLGIDLTGFGVGRGVAFGRGVGRGVGFGVVTGFGVGVGAAIVIVVGSTVIRSQVMPFALRARNQ